MRVAPRTRRTRDDQEKERRRGMVEENEASSGSRGFLRQTQTQHRLPRSYYGGQRIYKMASTGDLVIQGSGESRAGDRRSHRWPIKTNCQSAFMFGIRDRIQFCQQDFWSGLPQGRTGEAEGS